jgi:RND family efflux transporter MFP subunit
MIVPRAGVIAVAVLAIAGGAVFFVAGQNGGGSKQTPGTFVTAGRGIVETTVGGVGHVTTLSGAAQLSLPLVASSTSTAAGGASEAAAGSGVAGATSAGTTAAGSAGAVAPADAVFPTTSGHIARLLVRPGERVLVGQPVARISDSGASSSAVMQARADFSTARLELAQKKSQNTMLGPPPTTAEVLAGRQAVTTARTALRALRAPPPPSEVATARAELIRAIADLHGAKASPAAISVAELAVTTARQNLQRLVGPPEPAELAAAQLEVANALLAQASLSPEAIPAEGAAAQLAVTAAQLKLEGFLHPPAPVVTAAQAEVAKAELDVESLRATRHGPGLAALRAAVAAAKARLTHLRPTPAVISTAQSEIRKARADLAVLRQRGAPASATEQALARLKVLVGRQRLALAKHLAGQLTVTAPAAGTVTSVLTAVGAPVDAATPLIRVQDLSHLAIALQLSEFDVAHVRVGELTRISVDALGGRELKGRVIDVSPVGSEAGGVVNFPVTIALDATSGGASPVRPGMSVSARIVTRMRRNVVRIPATAVSEEGRPIVAIGEPSGTLRRRPVEIGLRGTSLVQVRSGLRPGDRVLIPAVGGE